MMHVRKFFKRAKLGTSMDPSRQLFAISLRNRSTIIVFSARSLLACQQIGGNFLSSAAWLPRGRVPLIGRLSRVPWAQCKNLSGEADASDQPS